MGMSWEGRQRAAAGGRGPTHSIVADGIQSEIISKKTTNPKQHPSPKGRVAVTNGAKILAFPKLAY